MTIDPGSSIPIYEQIAVAMRAAIAAGEYPVGDMLPSIRTLALELLVNPNTVKHAYDDLEREGLIRAVRGRGMEVTGRSPRAAMAGTQDAVRKAFGDAFDVAASAGITASEVDTLYREVRKSREGRRR